MNPHSHELTPGWMADAILRMLLVSVPVVVFTAVLEVGRTLAADYDGAIIPSILRLLIAAVVPLVCGLLALARSTGDCETRIRRAVKVVVAVSFVVVAVLVLELSQAVGASTDIGGRGGWWVE